MTDYQAARRARKSKAFFARQAERAAVEGNRREALRLLNVATYKSLSQSLSTAIMAAGA